jgi:hypothetical protein
MKRIGWIVAGSLVGLGAYVGREPVLAVAGPSRLVHNRVPEPLAPSAQTAEGRR